MPVDLAAVRLSLARAVDGGEEVLRVRLLVACDGTVRVESLPLRPTAVPLVATFAARPVDTTSPFLFHKTTHRAHYTQARVAGADETILWNRDGEVTEGLTTNIVAEIEGTRVTPPIRCGLLPGTYRAELIDRGEIREAVISKPALERADRIWLINSVHGSRPAELRPLRSAPGVARAECVGSAKPA